MMTSLYIRGTYFHALRTDTTHRFHAMEIAETMSLDCDAIVALSGDGLPHEILNGLASRPDAIKALRIPVVPVPSGSANGFSLNLHGLKVRTG
jgi:sphingosine kinase